MKNKNGVMSVKAIIEKSPNKSKKASIQVPLLRFTEMVSGVSTIWD